MAVEASKLWALAQWIIQFLLSITGTSSEQLSWSHMSGKPNQSLVVNHCLTCGDAEPESGDG